MQDYFDQISSSRRRRRGRVVEGGEKKFKSQRSLLKKKRRRRCDASARVLVCGCVNTMAFFLTTETSMSAQRPARLSSGGGGGFQVMYVCKSSQRTHGENKPVRGNQLRWQTQVQPLQPLLILGCKADEPAADLRGTHLRLVFGFCF